MIEKNVDESKHILHMHLDDCRLKDESFKIIIDAI